MLEVYAACEAHALGRGPDPLPLLDCFVSQKETVSMFPASVESFRPAAKYVFTDPPPGVEVFYDRHDLGIKSEQWRSLATTALQDLGLIVDRVLNTVILVGYATPVFLVALVLLIVFSADLQWLPFPTYVPLTQDPAAWAQNLLLPWIALALIAAAAYARMTRAQTLETLSEDHVRTARAYGLPERRVITRHVLRGALTPLVTMAAIDLANIMTSAVLTETMFGLPGIGHTLVSAVSSTDLPVIVGVTVTAGGVYVLANAVADILYAAIDPRVELA